MDKQIKCPECHCYMNYDEQTKQWHCPECYCILSESEDDDNDALWFCDGCGCFLNDQEGFDTEVDKYICKQCGYINIIKETGSQSIVNKTETALVTPTNNQNIIEKALLSVMFQGKVADALNDAIKAAGAFAIFKMIKKHK